MAKKRRAGLVEDEDLRAARLLDAQAKAAELFAAIGPRAIIAAGVGEVEASNAIRDLAADMFGVDRHWHKRIVRAGPNTLQPYRQNPPDRVITADDIVFCDFGPVFEQGNRFGRTSPPSSGGSPGLPSCSPAAVLRRPTPDIPTCASTPAPPPWPPKSHSSPPLFEELLDLGPGPAAAG